jgi:tetratricopeptide (TPR) repeat protein
MIQPRRYVAFVSYNHHDRAWAKWVHRALETYRVPARLRQTPAAAALPVPGRLAPVFLDREELSTSSSLAESVRLTLEQSDYLVVICSPHSARSHWVNEEIRLFKQRGRADHILCLIVDGEPNATAKGGALVECFPDALRYQVIDGRISEIPAPEPLAADVRPGMDGRRDARLKLVAGLLRISLDDLRRREQVRRQRRLTIIATAATIGFVGMAGLTAAAVIARNEAERQRQLAEQQSLTARRTADFMKSLFAVSDPSEARGNSITAREILDRGASQIATSLKDEPLVRAELMTTLGEVHTGLGLYKDGAALIEGARAIAGQGADAGARESVALGETEFLRGDYQKAQLLFDEAIGVLRKPDASDSGLMARALIGRGETLTALEKYDDARASLEDALATMGEADESMRARAIEGLGDAAYFDGKLDVAEARFREALALRITTSGEYHPKVAVTLISLGAIAYARGDPEGAAQQYERALQLERKVLGDRHPETAGLLNNLARIYLEQRNFAQAADYLEQSRQIKLAQVAETHDDMAFIFSNLALARAGLGDDAAAEPLFEKALRAAILNNHRLHGPILTDLADLRCREGRFAEGLKTLDEAKPIVAKRYPDEAWRLALIDNTRAGCLIGQGRLAEAEPLIAASTPALLDKWGAKRLYGYDALQRAVRLYTLTHDDQALAEYRALANR